jgi:RNA-directed DNA polymerase
MQTFNFTLDEVYNAFLDCRRKKRKTKDYLKFDINRERNLIQLHTELVLGTYIVGKSVHFIVEYPKAREVWAGNFRDRIVHHLLCNRIQDRFLKKFIHDSYSCIIDRGTLYGAQRIFKFVRSITNNFQKDAYYLQCDLSNYFLSINRDILYNLLIKYIHKEENIWLIKKILFHDPRKNYYSKASKKLWKKLPKHKTLFICDNIHGMPIGNLTSQFFSNVYLNELDQFIKRKLKIKYYGRYVDDFVLLHNNIQYLKYCEIEINNFLINNLDLKLNTTKTKHNLISKGIDFVGYIIKPGRIHLRSKTKNKVKNILLNLNDINDLEVIRQRVNSYLGMFKHSSSYQERKKICQTINHQKSKLVGDYPYLKTKVIKRRSKK